MFNIIYIISGYLFNFGIYTSYLLILNKDISIRLLSNIYQFAAVKDFDYWVIINLNRHFLYVKSRTKPKNRDDVKRAVSLIIE